MRRTFDGLTPDVADSAYVAETAAIVGDVVVGDGASVWPNATLRGDSGRIEVAEQANIQDNAVLHGSTVVERDGAVGHGGIVHQATVAASALVGMNAVVLDDARIGERSIVAAGSVVTAGTDVPAETLVAGAPAEPKAELDGGETGRRAGYYAELARKHAETSKRLDPDA